MLTKNLKLIALVLMLAGFYTKSFGQGQVVSGTVTGEDGPLPGATILEKGIMEL